MFEFKPHQNQLYFPLPDFNAIIICNILEINQLYRSKNLKTRKYLTIMQKVKLNFTKFRQEGVIFHIYRAYQILNCNKCNLIK